jgi:hypothetical protein
MMFQRPTNQPRKAKPFTRIVHLVEGTYELFRHFYGLRRLSAVNHQRVPYNESSRLRT